MLELDERIVFFDVNERDVSCKSDIEFLAKNKDFLHPNERLILDREGFINDTLQKGTVFVGFDSDFGFNNIMNSSFYKKDQEIQTHIFTPYNDDENYSGNNISTFENPYKIKNAYGQRNADPIFDNLDDEPFEDVESIEDINEFLLMPHEIKYPRYFNAYSILRLNSNICVFGHLDQINGDINTEKSLRGIKADLMTGSGSVFSRDKQVFLSNFFSLNDIKINENKKSIFKTESFLDEEDEDIIVNNEELLQRSFRYSQVIINGQIYTVFDTSENATSTIPQFTNKIIFYNEEESLIPPFDDTKELILIDSDHDEDLIHVSSGFDLDNSNGGMPDSFAFLRDGD